MYSFVLISRIVRSCDVVADVMKGRALFMKCFLALLGCILYLYGAICWVLVPLAKATIEKAEVREDPNALEAKRLGL